jgi:hypothetical protein
MEPEAAAGAPVVQMDYAYLSTEGELTTESSNAWATTLVMVRVGSGMQFSAASEMKVVDGVKAKPKYAVGVVVAFVDLLSLDTVAL